MILITAVLFIACVLVASRMMQRALARLSPEEKITLVDLAAKASNVPFFFFVLLVAGWVGVCFYQPANAVDASVAILILILLLSCYAVFKAYRRMKLAGISAGFLRSFLIGRLLRLMGASTFFATVCAWLFHRMHW